MYCAKPVVGSAQIDHFIPWSRHLDDGIENLVFAHARCNNDKRAHLAAEDHIEHWMRRLRDPVQAGQLAQLAADRHWESNPARTLSIARATYLNLPATYKSVDRRQTVRADRPGAGQRSPARRDATRPSSPRRPGTVFRSGSRTPSRWGGTAMLPVVSQER
ncbi:MAG: HNH endonuclease [Chloroflexota bacterium]|nr:HNH endonuclease [Chloroflexota bacterium]